MKKLLLPFLAVLLFTACQKQISNEKEQKAPEQTTGVAAKGSDGKIDVCHKSGNGTYQMINISANALPAHLAHGDIVPDADGDGYKKTTPCGIGDDCNDNNAAIHPGAIEICNGIDDNCNGLIDENCISATIICDQVWALNNLDVSTYRNGDPIPEVQDATAWANLSTGAWCNFANSSSNGTVYGKLYNWYAVNDPRGLAPAGWHVPTDVEWTTLYTCLGGQNIAGGKMKEAGTAHWNTPNTDATNSSGFTALPGGGRGSDGVFFDIYGTIREYGYWWSATEIITTDAWFRVLYYFNGDIVRGNYSKQGGFSVRCLRD